MTRLFARMIAIAIATFTVAGSAKADYIVDNFLNPADDIWAISFNSTFPDTQNYARVGDVASSGATRDMLHTVFAPNPAGAFSGQGRIGANLPGFAIGHTPGTQGGAGLTYTWGAAQDLTEGGANTLLSIHFVSADLAFPITITAYSGLNTLTYSTTVAAGSNFDFNAQFGSFTGTGSFASVTKLELSFNYLLAGTVDLDFRINNIRTTNVPAPPALFLVGAALPVIGVRRWMAKRKAVTAVA